MEDKVVMQSFGSELITLLEIWLIIEYKGALSCP